MRNCKIRPHDSNVKRRLMSRPDRPGVAAMLLFLCLLLPVVGSASIAGSRPESEGTLFVLRDEQGKGIAALRDLSIQLYLRIPPHYLVSASASLKGEMEERGFEAMRLGSMIPGRSLFVLTRPAGRSLGSPPSSGRILFKGDTWYLVEASRDLVHLFGEEGFRISAVTLHPLPMDNPDTVVPFPQGHGLMSSGAEARMAASDSTITRYLQRLENFHTRYSYSDSVAAAAEWIADKFIEFGFTDVAYDSFQLYGTWQRNVVATKPGTVNPDQVLVVGGHYDSVVYGDTCSAYTWAPGVDDNGTGTAMTMDMARILAGEDLEVTVKFVAFGAEEQGLFGSWHFAEDAYNSGMDIKLMVNMDMLGNLADSYLDVNVYTDNQSRSYAEFMSQVALDSTDLIPRISNSGSGSDHYPFQQYGFTYVYVEEGDFSPNWHHCSDILDNVDIPYLVQVEDMILPTIRMVANAPATPTGLAAADHGDGQRISLSWEANTEPDLSGYHVYTGPSQGEYDNVDTTLVNSFLLDNLIAGDSIYVAISAFDTDGMESVLSDPLGAVPLVRPRAPGGVDITSLQSEIDLAWGENEEFDIEGYIVYRMNRGGGAYAALDSVPAGTTAYTDQSAQPHDYYLYHLTAYDSSGTESDPSTVARGRLATHDSGILVIDATKDGTGAPFSPTDEDVDLFYSGLLSDFNLMAEWDYADSIAVDRRPVDADMSIYSTVVLHRDDRFGEAIGSDTLSYAKHLDSGGNLFLSGWALLTNLSGGQQDFQPGSFFQDYLKIASYVTTLSSEMDFIGARGHGQGYADISIDDGKVATDGLFSLNVFDADPVAGAEIYSYSSSDSVGSEYQGDGMGLEYIGSGYGVAVLNFPLYYMNEADALALITNAMANLGEGPSLVDGAGPNGGNRLPRVFSLGQNYPNPFNPSTTITYAIPEGSGVVATTLSVYDVRGRLIDRLVDEKRVPGYYQVHWSGRDQSGLAVSSGVYLYTIEAGDYSSTRKMVIVR